jgi:hypothetical protein
LSKDGSKGRLTEKSQVARAITIELFFQYLGSCVKFMTHKLAGSHRRSFHCSRQAASVLQNCAVAFRLNQVWRKPCQVKNPPKPVATAGEVVPHPGSAQRRIDPTKHYIKILAE